MKRTQSVLAAVLFFTAAGVCLAGGDFTIGEETMLSHEFSYVRWHDDNTAAVTRTDAPGDAVRFAFTGLTGKGAIMKDDYAVRDYGQILPSHGSGDFSNFDGYTLWIANDGPQHVTVSLFINTGFTGPSGVPSNNWRNDTFWQSDWTGLSAGQSVVLALDFDNATPWNIGDNPHPHTQGTDGHAASINEWDRTEISAIGFQVLGGGEGTILVRPIPEPATVMLLSLGAGLIRRKR